MGSIIIINKSSSAVSAFVSKWTNSNGDESWFNLPAGHRDSWSRNGWECVGFKNTGDSKRDGKYVPVDSTVVFHDFGRIEVL
ncbi:hypothetical protein C8Q76DRAFT_745891 [Earliella scabrosa]|nr:hypothetical protein C8Q76DRAFT_745891 [Earliella scabrosa]